MLETYTIPKTVGQSFYYVMEMPLNENNQGPCPIKDAYKIVYEVWDRNYDTHFDSEFLVDAINECNRLNNINLKELNNV